MYKLLRLCLLCVLAAPLTFAQQVVGAHIDNPPSSLVAKDNSASSLVPKEEQATKEDILSMLEVMHGRRNAEAAMQMMADNMKKGSRAGFLHEYPNASPAVLKKLDAVFDGAMKVVNVDELLAAMVPVYQKYISHEDAISIISFYSSPSGQRYLERMPALLKEVGEVSSGLVNAHVNEIAEKSKKSMEEFQAYVKSHPEEVGASAPDKSDRK